MPSDNKPKVSIAIPIIAILISILILTFTLQAFSIITPLSQDLIKTQQRNYTQVTHTLASLVNVEFSRNEDLVRDLAQEIEASLAGAAGLEGQRDPALDALLGWAVETCKKGNASFLTSFLLDKDGTVLFSSSENLVGKDLSQREYYKAIALEGNDPYTTRKTLTSASTGLTTIVHSAAVRKDGELRYILGTSYNFMDFADRHFPHDDSKESGDLFLLDAEGTFLIHPDEEKLFTSSYDLNPLFEQIISGKQDAWFGELSYDGMAKRGILSRINGIGWYVGLTQDNLIADQSVYHIRKIFIFSNILLILFITILISLYLRFKLIRKVKDLETLINKASRGQLTERGHIIGSDEIAGMTGHINDHLDSLSRFFMSLAENLGDLENVGGDLAANMEETAASLTQIKTSVNNTLRNIEKQENTVTSTAAAIEESDRNIQSLKQNIDKQNANIDQGTTAVEEMVAQINNINTSTGEAERLMSALSDVSREGRDKLTRVSALIETIADGSRELEGANTLISGIAAQTNLLAMNAAIEAAHAGAAGRGFAVVADEIRKLAEQSSVQSNQVKETISNINGQIGEAVKGSEESNRAFEAIRERIESMEQITREIRATMEEQTAGGTQVLNSFRELKDSGYEVNAGSAEMAEGNRLILNAVNDLTEICQDVTLAMKEIDGGMHEINKAAETISSLSHRNRKNIEDVRKQAALYKVS